MLAGCPLPIPHERALSPIFNGEVTDAETKQPISNVEVEVNGGYKEATVKSKTDSMGKYELGVTEKSNWYVILPAPAEGVCAGTITFTHPNYEPQSMKRSWFGPASFDGPCGRVKLDVALKPNPSFKRDWLTPAP